MRFSEKLYLKRRSPPLTSPAAPGPAGSDITVISGLMFWMSDALSYMYVVFLWLNPPLETSWLGSGECFSFSALFPERLGVRIMPDTNGEDSFLLHGQSLNGRSSEN